jgi:choline dehydrogenase-like flavoprotein
VTNSYGQCWDMKNLFITDGATLCSNADKNPTLTIMALAWRSADHMLGLMKKKEL